MITGSPYITNYSSKIVVHAELTHKTYAACPVHISVAYDSTSVSKVKKVCTPGILFGKTYGMNTEYRGHPGRWGIIEKPANAGDIVEVIIQGEVTFKNNRTSSDIGEVIGGFRPHEHQKSDGFGDPAFNSCYINCGPLNGTTNEWQYLTNNLGTVVNYGEDGKVIIWQGVQTPYISDYSHGESHRVQAKLKGTYSGDNNSIDPGMPVYLYLDTNGDLLARGGHSIGNGNPGFLHPEDRDKYHSYPGMWGICETGGDPDQVVDIVVAGHCQTKDTQTTANQQVSGITTAGEMWAFGSHIIKVNNDREFSSDSGNWTAYGTGTTVSVDSAITDKMKITTTSSSATQGATLPTSEMETLVVGKTYVVGFQADLLTTSDTPLISVTLGGGASFVNISTTNTYYNVEILCTNASAGLIIANTSSTAYEIQIDNVYVYQKDEGGISEDTSSRNWLPLSVGVTTNDTGGLCIFPGVNRYDIRDYKENQIITAKIAGASIDTARKHAVSLAVDKDGKLLAIKDSIPSAFIDGGAQYVIPNNKWGVALDAGSIGDDIKVLISGRISDMDTASDHTWVEGDILRKIVGDNGKKERNTGFEYEAIVAENDRTLESASNWAEYSPNTSITYAEDTANNRIKITGSGNGSHTNDTGGAGREGAQLTRGYLRTMDESSDSDFTSDEVDIYRMYKITADLWWSGSGTAPAIGATASSFSYEEGTWYPFYFEDGTTALTTTQRTGVCYCNAASSSAASASVENLVIGQVTNTTSEWYFTNVSLVPLPHTVQSSLGICLNSDKKEWYIY